MALSPPCLSLSLHSEEGRSKTSLAEDPRKRRPARGGVVYLAALDVLPLARSAPSRTPVGQQTSSAVLLAGPTLTDGTQ